MTIELYETTLRALWFVDWDAGNWLAALLRQEGEDWQIIYRFRYNGPNPGGKDPFEADDRKSWYALSGDDKERGEIAVDAVAEAVRKKYGAEKVQKTVVNGDGIEAYQALAKMPWAHLQFSDSPNAFKKTQWVEDTPKKKVEWT
jgi:hypothetical protein